MCPSVDYGGDGFLLGDGKLEAEAATCLRISEAVLREFSIQPATGPHGVPGQGAQSLQTLFASGGQSAFLVPPFLAV